MNPRLVSYIKIRVELLKKYGYVPLTFPLMDGFLGFLLYIF